MSQRGEMLAKKVDLAIAGPAQTPRQEKKWAPGTLLEPVSGRYPADDPDWSPRLWEAKIARLWRALCGKYM